MQEWVHPLTLCIGKEQAHLGSLDKSAKKPTTRNFEEMAQQAKAFIADTKYYKEAYANANPPVERGLGEKEKTKRRKPVLDSEGNKMEEPDAKYGKYKGIYQIPLVSTGKSTA